MTIRGRVKNGKVLLDDPKVLADGTEVEVRPARPRKQASKSAKSSKRKSRSTSLAERLGPFIGKAKGLPSDMSTNLDHYLYGLPRP
jgi:hypothetical protein